MIVLHGTYIIFQTTPSDMQDSGCRTWWNTGLESECLLFSWEINGGNLEVKQPLQTFLYVKIQLLSFV